MLRFPRILPVALAAALGVSAQPARADDTGSRWVAAIPFGAGQLQHGDLGLGIFFAAGEALLGGASITTMAVVNHLLSTPPFSPSATGRLPSIAGLNQAINGWTTANRVTFTGWAVLAAAGVIEAEVSFGPRRAKPSDQGRPPLAATVAATPGGGVLGVRAAF